MREEGTQSVVRPETFYTGFYGLQSSPFHVIPDPDNILLTEAHKHAIGAIYYGIVARKGFVVVTGEVGVGKTSVLRAALSRIDRETTKIVYLYNPRISSEELYQSILTSLGDTVEGRKFALHVLHYRLLKLYQRGVNVALVIDEAQNMPEQTLEDLRVLSNLETRANKLLQIVLVAQPELDAVLQKRSLRQLNQRIAVRATIPVLSFRQSFRYVRYRLAVAGNTEPDRLFSWAALTYIVLMSHGNPRKLNIYCDNALINGMGHRAKRVTVRIARDALRQFGESTRSYSFLRWVAAPVCIALLGVLSATSPHSETPLQLWTLSAMPVATGTAEVPAPLSSARPGSVSPIEPVFADASNEQEVVVEPAPVPQGPSPDLLTVPLSENPAGVEAENVPKPSHSGSSTHLDAAPDRPDRPIRVTVRRGDALVPLCRRIYGTCDNVKLRHVLENNPGIRSANALVTGQTLVFPTLSPPANVTEKE